MVDLHSAVRTAVDAQRAKANRMSNVRVPSLRAALLRECDWADDVLARHARYNGMAQPDPGGEYCAHCSHLNQIGLPYPCAELISLAAAFGVETGETP